VCLSSQAGRRMRSGDSWLQARLARQKVWETLISIEKSWVYWHVPVMPVTMKSLFILPGQKVRPYLQNNQNKKD
jgi:hypothetical protein